MEIIIGIDLGTTNSAVSLVQDGKAVMFKDERHLATLPSVVGFAANGQLLVGEAARNQALVAPERTVKSIKRKMGQDVKVHLAERDFSPQEISAIILRTLRERAEAALGQFVTKAVITVPAYFKDNQREATRMAGELAGLEVVRIINEPTAATLTYVPHSEKNERLLVYDLGGGTFDVSIVQIEKGVIEVLASHGDTQLGGDDFDQLLLDDVCERFLSEHGIDLRTIPVAHSRMLQAVERAKQQLSTDAVVTIREEFIAEKDGQPLNLEMEMHRHHYEKLIFPLLEKTITCVDAALTDAKLTASEIDRVILVGGSSRTPLVHRLLKEQLQHDPHLEIDPDLCVAMGAAIQGALIAGVDVGTVLIDITPHTLGIQCVGELRGRMTSNCFSPVIRRNTALPATCSEVYYTGHDGQEAARIHVLQGEHEDVTFNQSVGEFMLEGLDTSVGHGNEILVRFDLNLDGMLKVTAIERATGLETQLTVDNAVSRFQKTEKQDASENLAAVFGESPPEKWTLVEPAGTDAQDSTDPRVQASETLVTTARRLIGQAGEEDAQEIRELINRIHTAKSTGDLTALQEYSDQLSDLLFYLEDV
jgi:molecular chaperone DnaK